MKVYVDQDLCISCGLCIDICPAVFDWNDDGKADVIVDEVPADAEDDAREAMESCPSEAIKEE
ncbi:MAG: ferredoxin [Tepidanaerobacteraceae bacterium]|nr:ferredoxin [Tepidanaerobacter sp.]HQA61015.1 ferredoxin [Tepidanaerobacteraceae bacterium]HQE06185.1 ferredoxin [Tepidanaerobacteraceae bacterium]